MANIVVSRIKPSVSAVKNLLRSDTPKLTNIGLAKYYTKINTSAVIVLSPQ